MIDLEKMSARTNTGLTQLLTSEQVPTDDVVDPTVYVVGPGDVISLQTTGVDFTEKLAMVTPENTLLLERFGLINVANMTLQELRDSLQQGMRRRAKDIDVFVSLRRPRLVYVSLKGNVPFPGTYAVPASMRVSTLLVVTRQPWLLRKDAAVNEQLRTSSSGSTTISDQLTRSGGPTLSAYAMRNIVVRHRQGISLVDLPRSRMEGQGKLDPHLREGDVITVPYDAEQQATISIAGAVATSATLVYKPGDRASILLAAAGGPLSEADLTRVYLIQAGGEGKTTLSVNDKFEITGDDPELQPGSSIIVERQIIAGDIARQGVVEVYGEVREPGSVVIKPGVTRLSDVIEDAGGIKEGASLALSYIVRPERTPWSQREMSDESSRRFMYSDLKLEDTVRYKLDQSYRLPYVSCDMGVALADTHSTQNVTLQSGDVIVIERTPDRIFVYGQVVRPGYVKFVPNQTLDWYVEQAGGYATGAREGRSRIIKGKTKVWVEPYSDTYVEPGDEIYVPRPPDIPAGVELQTWAVVAGVVSSLAALTATIFAILQ
jgi:protein involved in polysaccharide export with SLBB domain